ncbi:MAG: hypothetical protein ACLQUZ_12810 [Rhizomicrobium sp.]
MTLLDVFLGDSALLRAQEQALIEQEDRVFQLVEGEHSDLRTHVRADIPRFAVLNARQRFGQAHFDRKSDMNFLITAIGFAVILAKLFGGFDLLLKGLYAF